MSYWSFMVILFLYRLVDKWQLKGRYDDLERRYQELQEQQKRLTDILDRMSQSQGR